MTIQRTPRIRFLSLLLLLFAAGNLNAAQQAGTPPAVTKPVALPQLSFKRLLNDLQITVSSTPQLGEGMTLGLMIRYGSAFDPADKGGLANLTAQMIGKATSDKSAKDIRDELEYLGATVETQCNWDGIRFIVRGSSSKFERALLLLFQMIGEAQLNEDDLVRVKADILAAIERPQDPRHRMRTLFENALFRGTTYGRPLQGTKQSLQNISIGDVRLFYRRYFSPNSAALVLSGSAPPDAVLQKASRIWGVWVRNDEVPFTFLPPQKPAARVVYLEDDASSPAAQVIMGNLWPAREDPSYYAATLAARILQERLTKHLPTSLLTVVAEGRRMNGPFYIQGQAAAEQAVAEFRKITDIVESLKQSGVSPEELTEAQRRWIDEFNAAFNSNDGICTSLLNAELYRLGTNYAVTFAEFVRRTDVDTLKEAAKEWIFPGGVLLYIRGPATTLKPALEALGSIQTVTP